MLTQTILEQLKARAYETNAAATGNALADLINWIALHAARLDGQDMSVMLSAALALYKIEIEKNWEVSATDLLAVPVEPVPPASHLPPSDASDSVAAQDGSPAPLTGRRWTDTGHWALTLR